MEWLASSDVVHTQTGLAGTLAGYEAVDSSGYVMARVAWSDGSASLTSLHNLVSL